MKICETGMGSEGILKQYRILNFMCFRLVLRQDKIYLMSLFFLCALLRMKICNNWENKNGEL